MTDSTNEDILNVPVNETTDALPQVDAPVHRLDADMYSADDIDGITESLFGSGNLNYLTLQSRQTDALLNDTSGDVDDVAGDMFGGAAAAAARSIAGMSAAAAHNAADSRDAADLSFNEGTDTDIASITSKYLRGGDGGDSVSDVVRNNIQPANNGIDGNSATAQDGIDGIDGKTPPVTPPNPPGTPDIDLFQHNDLGLQQLDVNLDPIEAIIGDIDIGIDITHGNGGAQIETGILFAGIDIADITVPISLPIDLPAVDGIIDNLPGFGDIMNDPIAALEGVLTGAADDAAAFVTDALNDPMGTVTELVDQITDIPALAGYAGEVVDGLTGNLHILDQVPLAADTVDAVNDVVHDVLGMLPDIDSLTQDPLGALNDLAEQVADLTALADNLPLGDNSVADLADTLTAALGDPTELVENLLGNGGLPLGGEVLEGITDVLGNPVDLLADPTELVENLLGNGGLPLGGELLDGLDDPAEVVENLLGGDALEGITDVLGNPVDLLADPTALVENLLGNGGDPVEVVENLLGGLLGGGGVGDADILEANNLGLPELAIPLDPVEAIVGDIDIIGALAQNGNGLDTTLDTIVADIPLIDAVLSLAPDGSALSIPTLLGDAAQEPGDADLLEVNNLGLPELGVNLDAVEAIVGDIDIVGDLAHNGDALDVNLDALVADLPIADAVLGLDASDIQDSVANLLDGHLESSPSSDVDLVETNGLGLPELDINLDPVEAITGDIDLVFEIADNGNLLGADVTIAGMDLAAIDIPLQADDIAALLGGSADELDLETDSIISLLQPTDLGDTLAGLTGGALEDVALWPQSSALDGGIDSLFSGMDLVSDMGGLLPDPGGSVAEGLGLLHDVGSHSGFGGGLFGGGLFG